MMALFHHCLCQMGIILGFLHQIHHQSPFLNNLNKPNKILTKSVLFISDSNLDNPILDKQGLPLLVHLSNIGYKVFFVFLTITMYK